MSPFDEMREALKAALNAPIIYTGGDHEPIATCGIGMVADLKAQMEAALTRAAEGPDDDTVERKPVWPLLHTMLVQFARRIAEADAAPTHDERVRKINAVSAHMAVKLEEYLDAPRAISALTKMEEK